MRDPPKRGRVADFLLLRNGSPWTAEVPFRIKLNRLLIHAMVIRRTGREPLVSTATPCEDDVAEAAPALRAELVFLAAR